MNLFPASLLVLLICRRIYEQESRYLCNRTKILVIWISVVACESSPIPCPHPSTLTCVSLTMETFSPRVRGGLELWERKKNTSNYSLLPLSCHYWKLTSAHSAPLSLPGYFLIVNSRGRLTDQTAGKLTRAHGPSHLQWLLKIPPRLEHVLCKQVLAQQDKAGHLQCAVSKLAGNLEMLVVLL